MCRQGDIAIGKESRIDGVREREFPARPSALSPVSVSFIADLCGAVAPLPSPTSATASMLIAHL